MKIERTDTNGTPFTQIVDFPEYSLLEILPTDATLEDYVKAIEVLHTAINGIQSGINAEPTPTPEEAQLLSDGYSLADAKIITENYRRMKSVREEIITAIMPILIRYYPDDTRLTREFLDDIINDAQLANNVWDPRIGDYPYRE